MAKPRREGVYTVDHRYSPGVSIDDLIRLGVAGQVDAVGGGKFWESATITCLHCNTVVILNPKRTRPRNYCAKCDGYICDSPACGLECRNFDKMLDKMQEKLASHTHLFIDGKCVDCGELENGWVYRDIDSVFNVVEVSRSLLS